MLTGRTPILGRNAIARGLLVAACLTSSGAAWAGDPPFSSTADTVFDIIRAQDPSDFLCLDYLGRERRQMWDKRRDGEDAYDTFLFRAYFSAGPAIDIILNPEFGTEEDARAEAMRYTGGLGRLPLILREGIAQFGIHKGDRSFHGGPGKIFMYQDKASLRIAQNKLEESILHEAVHASIDARWRDDPAWRAAQDADPGFVTRYAADKPEREDLAESVLFALALLRHPGRIPPVDSADILRVMPNRIDVVETILETPGTVAQAPLPPDTCR
ncbi:MAG: hypothetical protein CML02_03710 [Pseudooceanicola sp.]|jgi:hypothetical protein|nr:hypothetical protein [Pseudooceanicola sp.]